MTYPVWNSPDPNNLEYKFPKKVLIGLPPGMLYEVDRIAKQEHRTRSDLIREALRRYIAEFNRTSSYRISQSPRPVVLKPEGSTEESTVNREDAVVAGMYR